MWGVIATTPIMSDSQFDVSLMHVIFAALLVLSSFILLLSIFYRTAAYNNIVMVNLVTLCGGSGIMCCASSMMSLSYSSCIQRLDSFQILALSELIYLNTLCVVAAYLFYCLN
jgi:hypothetical protein